MPKPVCLGCRCFYRPKKNGFAWIEGMPDSGGAPRGVAGNGQWSPYKLWVSDLWACPECGHEIVVGHCQREISEHYLPGFAEAVAQYKAEVQINDC